MGPPSVSALPVKSEVFKGVLAPPQEQSGAPAVVASVPPEARPPPHSRSQAVKHMIAIAHRPRVYPGDSVVTRLQGAHPVTYGFPRWPWNLLAIEVEAELLEEPKAAEACNRIRWEQN